MSKVKIVYSEVSYSLLINRDIEILNFLHTSLFENMDNKHSTNELKDILLSYHMEEGGS
jgi:hypothetical protein